MKEEPTGMMQNHVLVLFSNAKIIMENYNNVFLELNICNFFVNLKIVGSPNEILLQWKALVKLLPPKHYVFQLLANNRG